MKRICFDIETDGIESPTKLHCVCVHDLDTKDRREFHGNVAAYASELVNIFSNASVIVGHNIIEYDLRWLSVFVPEFTFDKEAVVDTLVLSRLLWQDRPGGHGLEAWGDRFKYPKPPISDFSEFTPELLHRCHTDVEINIKLYEHLLKKLNAPNWHRAVKTELAYQWIARDMHDNGFAFNVKDAVAMLEELDAEIAKLDDAIQKAFPPTVKITQLKTKQKIEEIQFNPASSKQLVDRLWEGGWKPTERTKGHVTALKDRSISAEKLENFKRYGWKVNEANVGTLPDSADPAYHHLVERLLVDARRRTLVEWLEAYNPTTGRIHGRFNPLGTRTQRCVHTNPNMGNVPTRKSIKYNSKRLRDKAIAYGARMRSMWVAGHGAWLVGADMESAHLRIFAHLIDDKPFIEALVSGRKEDGTDPHSLNRRALGEICVDRDRAKTFIFTFLNGGGAAKVAEIFSCSAGAARDALTRFIASYPGLKKLREEQIPKDAQRGYFRGVDGRFVINDSEHHMIGFYLQNTEAVIMKTAHIEIRRRLHEKGIDFKFVNFVHDEVVTEVYGDEATAKLVGEIQAECIKWAGAEYGLRCPLGGESKIGRNWLDVH